MTVELQGQARGRMTGVVFPTHTPALPLKRREISMFLLLPPVPTY